MPGRARNRGIVAGREHGDVAELTRAVGEADGDAAGTLADSDTFAANDGQTARAIVLGQERCDEARNVIAIEAAWYKAERVGTELLSVLMRRQPAPEMIRILRQRAHIGGTHVQQMIGISGVVGEPAADLRALLDQGNADVGMGLLQQLIGQQNAGCSATDDDHVSFRKTAHAKMPFLSRADHA